MFQKKDWIEVFVVVVLILFGLYVGLQIIKLLIGGSWDSENILIALIVFSLGLNITILRKSDANYHKLDSLTNSFKCLASDYKVHMRELHHKRVESNK